MDKDFERVIFSYLDGQDFIQIDKSDNIYFVNSEDDNLAQIRYLKESGMCFIYIKFIVEICKFFSLEHDDSKEVIGRWVENTTQMEVKKVFALGGPFKKDFRIPN